MFVCVYGRLCSCSDQQCEQGSLYATILRLGSTSMEQISGCKQDSEMHLCKHLVKSQMPGIVLSVLLFKNLYHIGRSIQHFLVWNLSYLLRNLYVVLSMIALLLTFHILGIFSSVSSSGRNMSAYSYCYSIHWHA